MCRSVPPPSASRCEAGFGVGVGVGVGTSSMARSETPSAARSSTARRTLAIQPLAPREAWSWPGARPVIPSVAAPASPGASTIGVPVGTPSRARAASSVRPATSPASLVRCGRRAGSIPAAWATAGDQVRVRASSNPVAAAHIVPLATHTPARTLEDQVLHLAGQAQCSDLAPGREDLGDRDAGGAHPVGRVLLCAAIRGVDGGVLRTCGGKEAPLEVEQCGFRGGGAEVEGEQTVESPSITARARFSCAVRV